MPPNNNKLPDNNNGQVVTGKAVIRAMIILGFASVWINFRYYSNLHNHSNSLYNDDEDGTVEHIDQDLQFSDVIADNNNNNNNILQNEDTTTHGNNKKKVKKTFQGEFSGGQLVKRDKKGNIVVNAITSLNKDELGEAAGDDDSIGELTLEEATKGREPLLKILREAGIQDFDAATVARLPTWDQIEKLYGEGPVIFGLDTCEQFRKSTPPADASIGSAGIFNSGTNTLAMYMNANCIMPENKKEKYGGMRWQVPWGKHMVAKRKWTNTVRGDKKVNKTQVMPVVAIRDPFSWMQSMCRHPYAAKWHHTAKHCPNLVPTQDDLDLFPYLEDMIPVRINYPEKAEHFESLAHVWTDWYGQYFHADYPRLIVRFEDLLFNAKEMINTVCSCVGGVPRQEGKFAYVVDSGKFGKGHPTGGAEKHTNMISAMVKYGTDKHRFTSMTDEDLTVAFEALDAEMMMTFQYEVPPPP